jgi:hypothetical protein
VKVEFKFWFILGFFGGGSCRPVRRLVRRSFSESGSFSRFDKLKALSRSMGDGSRLFHYG